MIDELTKGVYIISITPFTEDGCIDFRSVDKLVEFYLEKGISGMTILGMMGEANKLSSKESEDFVSYVFKRVNGRVPVLVGVSDAGLTNLVKLTRFSLDKGCAGVMVAPVSGLNTDQKVYSYFYQIFNSLGPNVPVCFQDYPQSTGVHLSVECFKRMVSDFPSFVMLKHEDCPGLDKLSQIRDFSANEGLRRVSILTGNGGLYLPLELMRGADGAMTGFAYPEMLVSVISLYVNGEVQCAENVYDAYLPLVRYEQQPGFGLAVRKEVLYRRGAIDCAISRFPGPSLTRISHSELDHLTSRLESKLKEHE